MVSPLIGPLYSPDPLTHTRLGMYPIEGSAKIRMNGMIVALALLAKERNTLGDLTLLMYRIDVVAFIPPDAQMVVAGEWIDCLALCPASLGRFLTCWPNWP